MIYRTPSQWLTWICSSNTTEELVYRYDEWADTYDSETSGVWKVVPVAVAAMLEQHVPNKASRILDVGAGTGLVGVALSELGYRNVIGADISSEMIAKAAEKGVYRDLRCCAIGDEEFQAMGKAAGIVASGVFAEAHAGPDELRALQASLDPSGVIAFTARESYLSQLQEVVGGPEWKLIDSKTMPIYPGDATHLFAYRVL